MAAFDWLARLRHGLAIPAHPLALTSSRRLDERRQRALTRYVGGQLLFSLVMGSTAALALYLFGVLGIFPAGEHYAIVFGMFFGLMELIPYLSLIHI